MTNKEEKISAVNVKNLLFRSISVNFVQKVSVQSAQLKKHTSLTFMKKEMYRLFKHS
jgi:hypothetical protein